jgi:hypothetical protein
MDLFQKLRKAYEEQIKRGMPSAMAQFSYAHGLTKSTKDNVRIGIFLFEGLFSYNPLKITT